MNGKRKLLIVILGPTGSGKSDLAVTLAQRFGAPVLSADSRQVYRGMAIGTAQPDPVQLAAAPHYMIANHDIGEHFTSGDYETEALEILGRLFTDHDAVIAAGGSGLYIDALCHGLDPLPEGDPELRAALEERWRREGPENLLSELEKLDPVFYAQVDKANGKRVVRALEVCIKSGLPYSAQRSGKRRERDFRILKIGTQLPRAELYARIDRRVDAMMEAGLEREARALYPHRELNALQTVGYRELFRYFDGEITREEAVELIKRNSRRYAKRQITWFARDGEVRWFDPARIGDIASLVSSFISSGR